MNSWTPVDLQGTLAEWAGEQAQTVGDAVRTTVPVKSGRTQANIESEAVGDEIQVTGDAVAGYLLHGTEEHGPVTAPLLKFQIDGQWISRHEVAGIAPDPFIENAIDAFEDQVSVALLDKCAAQWATT